MSKRRSKQPGQQGETLIAVDTDASGPRKMTFAENVILTVKVLAGFGTLGVVLWGISVWSEAR